MQLQSFLELADQCSRSSTEQAKGELGQRALVAIDSSETDQVADAITTGALRMLPDRGFGLRWKSQELVGYSAGVPACPEE